MRSKSDGVVSQHIVFNRDEARRWFDGCFGNHKERQEAMRRAEILLPCGRCAACMIRKRRDMSVRLYHETTMYNDENCCFITLTYNDDNVPVTDDTKLNDGTPKPVDRGSSNLQLQTLLVSDVQKFVKRLRRHLEYLPKSKQKRIGRDHVTRPIRYFCCGEYGSKFRRPHYHLIIFGWRPSDLTPWQTRNGHMIYRSAQIEKLWKFGFSTVAPVQGGVAAYCAKYVTKKFARLNDEWQFKDCVFPEFSLQSVRHGGIGAPWYDNNFDQLLTQGFASVRLGDRYVKMPIPSYYWRRARKKHLCLWLQLRDEKIRFAESQPHEITGFDELVRKCKVFQAGEEEAVQYELF